MSEIDALLVELGETGTVAPQRDDRGDQHIRAALQAEIHPAAHRRRRVRVPFLKRSVALLPTGLLAAFAVTAAAATVALVSASPLRLFERNPQRGFRGETVIASSIVHVATVRIPDFGPIQYWAATTKQGGRCWGLRNNSGKWLTLGHTFDDAGSIPGCGPTRKQQVLAQGNSPVGLAPTAVDELSNSVKLPDGRWWDIYYGTVNANGAVAVRDPATGETAPVRTDQRFILVEPNSRSRCLACDQLRAINSQGRALRANYGPLRYREY